MKKLTTREIKKLIIQKKIDLKRFVEFNNSYKAEVCFSKLDYLAALRQIEFGDEIKKKKKEKRLLKRIEKREKRKEKFFNNKKTK